MAAVCAVWCSWKSVGEVFSSRGSLRTHQLSQPVSQCSPITTEVSPYRRAGTRLMCHVYDYALYVWVPSGTMRLVRLWLALPVAVYLLLPSRNYYWDGVAFAINVEKQ